MSPVHVKKSHSLSGPGPAHHSTPSVYSQVSSYRASKLQLQIYSRSVKVEKPDGAESSVGGSLVPVFNGNDTIEGKVILDPSCHHSGTLSITVEGALCYRMLPESSTSGSGKPMRSNGTHVFSSSSTTINVSPLSLPRPSTPFGSAFANRRPSAPTLSTQTSSAERPYSFSIPFPREPLPSTLVPRKRIGTPVREELEINYEVIAAWYPSDSSSDSVAKLAIPIHFEPKEYPLENSPNTWMEIPLRSDHPVSYRCAVTLPTSATFSRGLSLPFFVVFATNPKSRTLASEIAADATVSISLMRKITMLEQVVLPPSPPITPVNAAGEKDGNGNKLLRHVRSLNLLQKAPPKGADDSRERPSTSQGPATVREKPLPRLPTHTAFTNTKTLDIHVNIGFPKRPRHPRDSRKHPTLEEMAALPDGLCRSEFILEEDSLPSIDVSNLSVDYYLEISVAFNQDDLRARIPVSIV